MVTKIRSLHPTRDHRDDLPAVSSNPLHCLQVSRKTVEDVCRGIHTNTTEGPDGWSANVLKQLFHEADDMLQGAAENDDLIGRLQKVINRITSGLMPKEVRYCLVRLKSILIPKFDTGGHHIVHRPIGIMPRPQEFKQRNTSTQCKWRCVRKVVVTSLPQQHRQRSTRAKLVGQQT